MGGLNGGFYAWCVFSVCSKKLTNDMQDVKPTLFCGVPRVYSRMHQVIMNGVAEKPWLVRWYFNRAFSAQSELIRKGKPVDPGYDARVFAALRKKMGLENVRYMVTGAAPLAPYLAEFLKVVTGKPLLEGYGQCPPSARRRRHARWGTKKSENEIGR